MNQHKNCPICQSNHFVEYLTVNDYFLTNEEFHLQKCVSCGFIVTNPFPTSDEIGRYYQSEQYYSHPDKKNSLMSRIYNFIKSLNIDYKYKVATSGLIAGTILDIGCGSGDFLLKAKNNDWKIRGIEPDDRAARFSESSLGINIIHPKQIVELENTQFDVITLWHVLEHVEDINEQARQLKRLLKTNGRLVIALPNINSFDAQYYGKKWAGLDVPRHLYHFSFQNIRQLLENHGFKFLKREPLLFDAYYISLLSQRYRSRFLYPVLAVFLGFISNLKAKKSREYSSNIYIFYLPEIVK